MRRLASTSPRAVAQFAFDRLQPAALGQPLRRAGRRVGGDGKAVPAPQIALGRNQPLAGLEQPARRGSVGAFDDADLGEPARKFGRRFHIVRQGGDAFGQARIGGIERRAGPVHRRGFADRRIEIVAEGGAKRLLVALGHRDRVHHRRPQILAFDRKQLADGLGFGFEPLHALLGGGERRARGVDLRARLLVRGFRRMRGLFGLGERGLRAGERLRQRRQIRRAGIGRGKPGVDIGEFGVEPRRALAVLAQGALELIAPRASDRRARRSVRQRIFPTRTAPRPPPRHAG